MDSAQPYEAQSPWPVLDKYQRQSSPDNFKTILSASTTSWNASPCDELCSSSIYTPYSAGSPSEFCQHRLSYPEQSNITSYPGELPPGGGSCAPQEIQFSPDKEPKQSLKEYERPDMKTQYRYEQEGGYYEMEVDSDNYPDHDDTALDNSLREAEFVQPVSRDDDAYDSEYQPVSTSSQTIRSRRRTSNSSNSSGNRNAHKRGLHGRKTSNASNSH